MDFVRCTFDAALYIARLQALWKPAVILSIVTDLAVYAVNWPFSASEPPPPEHTYTVMVLTILAKGWFSLTLCRIGLALLRNQDAGFMKQWVSVQMAIKVGVVCFVLLAPILLGLLVLVVPGLYMMVRWSQVAMLLLDGEANRFDAIFASGALTAGYRMPLMVVLFIVGAMTLVIEYFIGNIMILMWIYHALGSVFGASLAAATYYELNRRAPWNAVH